MAEYGIDWFDGLSRVDQLRTVGRDDSYSESRWILGFQYAEKKLKIVSFTLAFEMMLSTSYCTVTLTCACVQRVCQSQYMVTFMLAQAAFLEIADADWCIAEFKIFVWDDHAMRI